MKSRPLEIDPQHLVSLQSVLRVNRFLEHHLYVLLGKSLWVLPIIALLSDPPPPSTIKAKYCLKLLNSGRCQTPKIVAHCCCFDHEVMVD